MKLSCQSTQSHSYLLETTDRLYNSIHQHDILTNRRRLMESGDRTLLKTFPNAEAAELALAKLQANGIDGSIQTNDAGGMLPFLQVPEGVKLFVPATHFQEAMDLLNS